MPSKLEPNPDPRSGAAHALARPRVMTILGTRPEIIRLSRVIPLLDQACDHVLVHTGQNFTENLSGVFFRELGLRDPDRYLGVDTSSLGRQLATLFESFESLLDEVRPDRVLILGDTNSGLVSFNCKRRGIAVYHMEAGNRCYDDRVPEEVNRRVIDHCSSVLLPYTYRSAENLVREGIARQRIFVVGNPIYEVLEAYRDRIDASDALEARGLNAGEYLLATIHRAENVDDPAILTGICDALIAVAELYDMPLILSVHPRARARMDGGVFEGTKVRAVEAMPFFEFVKLERHARLVLTDSGTVQEECAIFRVPVITVRKTTERPETMESGSNVVSDTSTGSIVSAARLLRDVLPEAEWSPPAEYVRPDVSRTVVRILLSSPSSTGGIARP
jgi:UDP-N-acetylglucosamine 2-epimerase (non-hydrolysing)